MKNLLQIVEDTLLKNSKYVSVDNKLLKTIVYTDLMNLDKELLHLLLSNADIKNSFFEKIDDILIFDKQKFAWFINCKELARNSYTSYTNKIGLTSNSDFITACNDVVLDFPYKDCMFVGSQGENDEKIDEVFYHEIIAKEQISKMLTPKLFTNAKRYNKTGAEDAIEFKDGDNLIIKGNNLIVLSCLLKRYEGKVKCIYIDPPYNTGKDSFNYNDNFKHSTWLVFMKNRLELAKKLLTNDGTIFVSLDDTESHYLKVLMDSIFGRECFVREIIWLKGNAQNDAKNIQKNTECVLMYAKNINAGIYNEIKYTEVEIFSDDDKFYYKGSGITTGGEGGTLNARPTMGSTIYYNNTTGEIIVLQDYDIKKAETSNLEQDVYTDNVRLLNDGFIKIRPPKKADKLGCWSWGVDKLNSDKHKLLITKGRDNYIILKKEYIENIDVNKIIFKKNKMFYFKKTESPMKNYIELSSSAGTKELKALFNKKVFDNPKNESLIHKLLSISTNEGDLVLDFFLGSGTTIAAAHKMKRKYIGIEQMDYIKDIPLVRMQKVVAGEQGGISKDVKWNGGGDFVYMELFGNIAHILDAIDKATISDIQKIKNDVFNSDWLNPLIVKSDLYKLNNDFDKLQLNEKKSILLKLLDKNGLYIDLSDIEDADYIISNRDKRFNISFYK